MSGNRLGVSRVERLLMLYPKKERAAAALTRVMAGVISRRERPRFRRGDAPTGGASKRAALGYTGCSNGTSSSGAPPGMAESSEIPPDETHSSGSPELPPCSTSLLVMSVAPLYQNFY